MGNDADGHGRDGPSFDSTGADDAVKPRIYVAAAYSKGDTVLNVRTAIQAADVLVGHGLVPFIPHLTHFWHFLSPKSYTEWLEYDREWLRCCQAVLRLPGESPGADSEVALARELGLPVFTTVGDVVRHFFSLRMEECRKQRLEKGCGA